MSAAAGGKLYEYGVRRAPFLIEGSPALMAVDAFGTIRKIKRLKPSDDVEAIGERLWYWLLEHHPERRELKLVKDVLPAPEPGAPPLVKYNGRWIDPRLLSDPRSPIARREYVRRMTKAAARTHSAIRFRRED